MFEIKLMSKIMPTISGIVLEKDTAVFTAECLSDFIDS